MHMKEIVGEDALRQLTPKLRDYGNGEKEK